MKQCQLTILEYFVVIILMISMYYMIFLWFHRVQESIGDIYRFRRDYQMTTVQQMHQVLEAHVQLLDQVIR